MMKPTHFNSKLKAQWIILGFIFVLIGTSFTNGEFWPFVPYDMYSSVKASQETKFWFKVIHPNASVSYMRAESIAEVPRRFYMKVNLLDFKNIKNNNPERAQDIMDALKLDISNRQKAPVQIELYEETIYYTAEAKISHKTWDLLGASQ